ncbi:hypothetical protein AGOR_G00096100 [Albula goreensis]|uniref:Angiotensinogen n=1 Tax=Albula goreensis TaxID=1534307 RepID=A0A8T3DMJ8_9TELE|nr:hypothetical protein AGOR_G00096100 [Albula goreensis]
MDHIYDFLGKLENQSKMHRILRFLLLTVCFSFVMPNRVYIHPFGLFALENVSCQTVKAQSEKPLKTVKLMHIDPHNAEPKSHTQTNTKSGRQSVTQHISVLSSLQNSLGLRLYQAIKKTTNSLFSPTNAFETLVTFYFGASKETAANLQQFLGLAKETDKEGCISLFDGHRVLQMLKDIRSMTEMTEDEFKTVAWIFVSNNTDLSEDFVQGIHDFSDTSYIQAVDFSQPPEAEAQVNSFIQQTSSRKIKHLFKDISPTSDLLFASSIHFKGNWGTTQPDMASLEEFWINEKTSIKVPLMTQTGNFKYLNDKGRKCMVLKLPLNKRTYMLLVLPHEGAHLDHIEAILTADVISIWHQYLKEGLLKVSLPQFSINTVNDLKDILSHMKLPDLLGRGANFQRLSSKDRLNINQVLITMAFEMSGDGSENQYTTQDSGPVLKLTVNRPFMFTIIEGNSDAILLLGRITNPVQ